MKRILPLIVSSAPLLSLLSLTLLMTGSQRRCNKRVGGTDRIAPDPLRIRGYGVPIFGRGHRQTLKGCRSAAEIFGFALTNMNQW
jgi:hypothetical protein